LKNIELLLPFYSYIHVRHAENYFLAEHRVQEIIAPFLCRR